MNFFSVGNQSPKNVKTICERCSLDKSTCSLSCVALQFAGVFYSFIDPLSSLCDGFRYDLENSDNDGFEAQSRQAASPAYKASFGCCFSLLY